MIRAMETPVRVEKPVAPCVPGCERCARVLRVLGAVGYNNWRSWRRLANPPELCSENADA